MSIVGKTLRTFAAIILLFYFSVLLGIYVCVRLIEEVATD